MWKRPREANAEGRLTFDQRREEGDVGGFPPAGGQVEPDLLELVPQDAAAVLALGSAEEERPVSKPRGQPYHLHAMSLLSEGVISHGSLKSGKRKWGKILIQNYTYICSYI